MKVKFLEPAIIELDDAVRYYNEQVEGLGDKYFLKHGQRIPNIQEKHSLFQN